MTYDINTLSAARLWSYQPDWSSSYEVTRSFRTDVYTSRNNTEQRRALRDVPRLSAKYKTELGDDDLRATRHFLRARQNAPAAVPDFIRYAALTGASLSGATSLTLASPPAWASAGSLAVLCGDTAELVRITAVSGATLTLGSALAHNWPSGSIIRPALHGLLGARMSAARHRRGAQGLSVEIDCYPGGEPIEDAGSASTVFNGYEVFPTIEPDWSGTPALDYLWPVEQVDYGIGRAAQFRPVDLAQQMTEAAFVVDRTDATTLEQFFLRMKGMRGAFYLPSTEKDFALAATATSGSSAFLAVGTDLAADFGSIDYDAEPTAIEVVLTDGTRLHRLITGITTSTGNSSVAVDVAWPVDLTAANVARISWMPLARFASDDLVTSWRTPLTAQLRITFQTLRYPTRGGGIVPSFCEGALICVNFANGTYEMDGAAVAVGDIFTGFDEGLLVPGEGLMAESSGDPEGVITDLTPAALALLTGDFTVVMQAYVENSGPDGHALVILDAFDAGSNMTGFALSRTAGAGYSSTRNDSGLVLDALYSGTLGNGWHKAAFTLTGPVSAAIGCDAVTVGPSDPSPAVGATSLVELSIQAIGPHHSKVGVKTIRVYPARALTGLSC